MKKCSFCGAENEDAAVFCEECGKSFYKKCEKCGAENKLTAKFCNKCGARFIAPNTMCYEADVKIESAWITENSISHDFEDSKGYIVLKEGVRNIDGEIFKDSIGLKSLILPQSVTGIEIPFWTSNEFKEILPNNVWDKLKEVYEPHTIYYEADIKLDGKGNRDMFLRIIRRGGYTPPNKNWNYEWINAINDWDDSMYNQFDYDYDESRVFVIYNNLYSRGWYDGIDTYSISHIFSNGKGEIRLKNEIGRIGNWVFRMCMGLKSIVIPYSVTEIGYSAFRDCTNLNKIILQNSITKIDNLAFCSCSKLTSINIPNSVTKIGMSAFANCSKLTSINIPDSVTIIDAYAFSDCSSLTSINISNSVTSIGDDAFSGCSSLNKIHISEDNQTYDSRDNCNAIIKTATNELIVGCSTTIIPSTVSSISKSAFQNCRNLTKITIPNSVTEIGHGAFLGCTNLTTVNIPDSVTSIGEDAFAHCYSLMSITIPSSVTKIGRKAFYGVKNINYNGNANVVLRCGANTINGFIDNNLVFSDDSKTYLTGCSRMTTEIVIPNYVIEISWSAFANCSKLTSINIPYSVTKIWSLAFYNCRNLTSITIANSVTKIDLDAFHNCKSLKEIIVPKGTREKFEKMLDKKLWDKIVER